VDTARNFVMTVTIREKVEMTRNMGTFDRGLRAFVVAPAAVVVAIILGVGTLGGVVLLVVGGIMVVTGVTGFCPTYTVVGISTYPRGLHRVGHRVRGGHA
jgi:hypothetical protein